MHPTYKPLTQSTQTEADFIRSITKDFDYIHFLRGRDFREIHKGEDPLLVLKPGDDITIHCGSRTVGYRISLLSSLP